MNMTHHKKMSGLQGGKELPHVNEMVSPYSILRESTEKDVDTTINIITSSCGPRTNRAQLLRQLALKQKIEQNPFLGRTHRFSKAGAIAQGDDPNFNNLNMNYPNLYKQIYPTALLPHQLEDAVTERGQLNRLQRIRIRNSRGSYDTIDTGPFTQRNSSVGGQSTNRQF